MRGFPVLAFCLLEVFVLDRVSLELSIVTGLAQSLGIQVARTLPSNTKLSISFCQDRDTSCTSLCVFVWLPK